MFILEIWALKKKIYLHCHFISESVQISCVIRFPPHCGQTHLCRCSAWIFDLKRFKYAYLPWICGFFHYALTDSTTAPLRNCLIDRFNTESGFHRSSFCEYSAIEPGPTLMWEQTWQHFIYYFLREKSSMELLPICMCTWRINCIARQQGCIDTLLPQSWLGTLSVMKMDYIFLHQQLKRQSFFVQNNSLFEKQVWSKNG